MVYWWFIDGEVIELQTGAMDGAMLFLALCLCIFYSQPPRWNESLQNYSCCFAPSTLDGTIFSGKLCSVRWGSQRPLQGLGGIPFPQLRASVVHERFCPLSHICLLFTNLDSVMALEDFNFGLKHSGKSWSFLLYLNQSFTYLAVLITVICWNSPVWLHLEIQGHFLLPTFGGERMGVCSRLSCRHPALCSSQILSTSFFDRKGWVGSCSLANASSQSWTWPADPSAHMLSPTECLDQGSKHTGKPSKFYLKYKRGGKNLFSETWTRIT